MSSEGTNSNILKGPLLDTFCSPYLDMEFEKARENGVIPKAVTQNIGGSWSALSDAGEATNLNLAHVQG